MHADIERILSGPDYFFCGKALCRLRFAACIQRQAENDRAGRTRDNCTYPHDFCVECQQGMRNMKAFKRKGSLMQRNPVEEKGIRFLGCDYYAECLNEVASKGWEEFSCGECSLKEVAPDGERSEGVAAAASRNNVRATPKTKAAGKDLGKQPSKKASLEKRLCSECRERSTITPRATYCAKCMAARGNRKRWEQAALKKEAAKPSKPPAPDRAKGAITITFGKYAKVLEAVTELAEREMRSLDMQIIFILNRHLEGLQMPSEGAAKQGQA